MLRFVLFCFAAALCSTAAIAQDSLRPVTDAFFTTLIGGQAATAYAKLLEGSNIKKDPKVVEKLRRDTELTQNSQGKYLAADFIREERFGTSVVRLVYVLKSERHATVWEFYFYKPKSAWILAQVQFNSEFHWLDAKNRN